MIKIANIISEIKILSKEEADYRKLMLKAIQEAKELVKKEIDINGDEDYGSTHWEYDGDDMPQSLFNYLKTLNMDKFEDLRFEIGKYTAAFYINESEGIEFEIL